MGCQLAWRSVVVSVLVLVRSMAGLSAVILACGQDGLWVDMTVALKVDL